MKSRWHLSCRPNSNRAASPTTAMLLGEEAGYDVLLSERRIGISTPIGIGERRWRWIAQDGGEEEVRGELHHLAWAVESRLAG